MKKIYIEKGDFPWSNLKGLYKDAIYFPIKMSIENQPVVGLKVLGRIIYITSDRDLIQAILNSHSDKIIKGSFAKKLSLVIGNGMITAEGNEWKEQRQLIQPLFNNNYLKTYFSIISDQAQLFINKCNKINGTEIMMFEEMNKLSFNIICETTLGNLLIDKHPNVIKDIINMGRFLNIMNILGISNPWIKLNPTFQIYNKKIKKIRASLSQIISQRQHAEIRKFDLLDQLLFGSNSEKKINLDENEIIDEILTFILAGFKTVSSALAWFWYVLAKNKDVQEKVYNEISQTIGSKVLVYEDLTKLSYTYKVILETLRLYSPVFNINRQTIDQDVEIGGFAFPANSNIIISIQGLHLHPAYWDLPHEFNPERFNDEKTLRTQHKYMPFGAFKRTCIGNHFAIVEMLIVIASLAQQFKFSLPKDFVPKVKASISNSMANDLPMKVNRII